jgi:hypothetical protein
MRVQKLLNILAGCCCGSDKCACPRQLLTFGSGGPRGPCDPASAVRTLALQYIFLWEMQKERRLFLAPESVEVTVRVLGSNIQRLHSALTVHLRSPLKQH